jgi:hypothetical protein
VNGPPPDTRRANVDAASDGQANGNRPGAASLPRGFDEKLSGELLLYLDRTRRGGNPEGVAVTLESFEGHRFIRVQRWSLGSGWRFDPDRQVTIREREARPFVEALSVLLAGGGR